MRINLLLVIVMVSMVSAGCGEPAGQQAQASLDAALQKLQAAERGYVPPDRGDLTLQGYRQQTLAEALSDLDRAIDTGNPAQRVAAAQLKSTILLSQARERAREAANAYATIGATAGSMVRYIGAVNRADSLVRALDRDLSPIVTQLQQEAQVQRQRLTQVQTQVSQLEAQIQELQAQQQELRTQARQAVQQAQQLRDQAFVTEGREAFDLEERAAQLQLQSQQGMNEADRRQAQVDALQSQLAVAQAESQAVQSVIRNLQLRGEESQKTQTMGEQNLAAARQSRRDAVQQLLSIFDEVTQAYAAQVDQPLLQATNVAEDAVTVMDEAVAVATPPVRQEAQLGQLNALTTEAALLAEHAMTAGGFGRSLSVLAQHADDLAPEQASAIRKTYQDLRQSQQRIMTRAEGLIEQGLQLAEQVGGDTAAQHAQNLRAYAQQIGQSKLQ